MAKAVLTIKANSGYDDVPELKYHFPKRYLKRVQQAIGDLFVYYESRRDRGRLSYIATGQIVGVTPDPQKNDHFYAQIANFQDFDAPVPFRGPGGLFERALASDGTTGLSGDFRNAVRVLADDEFEAIVAAGFRDSLFPQRPADTVGAFAEDIAPFERPIVETILRRPFRDEAFARHVKGAYQARCAFTGLDMRNGGGRTEVDAAHIKPVGDGHNGPDSVRNGLALSKTVHWMFDRGLISVDSDYRILTARNLVPEPIKRLLNPSMVLNLPEREAERPHPVFLEYHRNKIFKEAKT